jgi:predicted nucleic acid-binding protein
VNLLDLNVWFALLVPEHPFHPRARAYWEQASDPFLVRVTALGLLRLLTNAKAMDGKPLGVREAWEVYRELRLSSWVPLLEEPQGLDEVLADLVRGGFLPGSGRTPTWRPSPWRGATAW